LERYPAEGNRGHYPGAAERWQAHTADRSVKTFGERSDDVLPWALVTALRAADTDERSFRDEAFCSVLSETPLDVEEPTAFLDAAVEFANERLWGTLVATVIVHPRTVADRRSSAAVERAIARLRYGTVGLNIWGAYGFALGTTSWGGHPGATLQNVESGIGFVHNSQMVEEIEKCVLRSPFRVRPKPSSHASFGSLLELGRQLSEFEADRSPRAFLGAVAAGMRG
jgi:aldehyde dehydrogenase (NAD(P)+)